MSLRKYKKSLDYSYTLGVYPTLDLLNMRPEFVRSVILDPRSDANSGVIEIKKICDKNKIRYDYGNRPFKLLAVKDNTYAIGVFSKFDTKLEVDKNHVVLVNPINTGNVGTIIRSMLGFNVTNLALIKPCVDVFEPKIVRSAMGALFDINIEYFDTFDDYIKKFTNNNLYPFMLAGKTELSDTKFKAPFSLVFGTEGSGLDDKFQSENSVYIKQSNKIDSLNLAIAASIVLYKTTSN